MATRIVEKRRPTTLFGKTVQKTNINEGVGIGETSGKSTAKATPSLHRLLDIIEKHSKAGLTVQDVAELKSNIDNWSLEIAELAEKISQIDMERVPTVDSSERVEDSEKWKESLEIEDSSISSFVENMEDCINDFIASISAYVSEEELYEYCTIEMEALSDYDNKVYVYTTKAKAKVACKEAIKSVWNDLKDSYEVEKENIISYAKDYFEGLEEEFTNFLSEFLDSYDEYAELECEGDSKEYVASKKSELFDFNEEELLEKTDRINFETISRKIESEIFSLPLENIFDIKECLSMCSFDSDDEYYCFNMETPCSKIYTDVNAILDKAVKDFPNRIFQAYLEDIIVFTELLTDRLKEL